MARDAQRPHFPLIEPLGDNDPSEQIWRVDGRGDSLMQRAVDSHHAGGDIVVGERVLKVGRNIRGQRLFCVYAAAIRRHQIDQIGAKTATQVLQCRTYGGGVVGGDGLAKTVVTRRSAAPASN